MKKITPITKKREIYSDFFSDFTENPVSSDLARKTNEDSVKESIRNLIFTNKGERLFQPEIGGNVQKILFENINPSTVITLKESIKELIINYEPRANLIDVDVISNIDDNFIKIIIVFGVINNSEEITLVQTIDRVR